MEQFLGKVKTTQNIKKVSSFTKEKKLLAFFHKYV